jgi:ADP-ribose pyrophosphatase
MTVFLGEDLKEGEQEPMEDERIQVQWFRPKELDAMIAAGKIQDAKTIVGFLTWQRYHRRRK